MPTKSSSNDKMNPYQKSSFWLKQRTRIPNNLIDRFDDMINSIPKLSSEWTRRPKNWRKVNGYGK